MKILLLRQDIENYLRKRALGKKFAKQKELFEVNPFHPSLKTELLEPKWLRVWSFRIDRQYRAIFIFHNNETAEIVDINNHYG
jgi:plasmid maintenance system killer protein